MLVELARRLTDATREVDVVTRFGGEEFALILPKTPVQGIMRLAEKVREVVANEPFAAGNASITSISAPARCNGGPSALIMRILIRRPMLDVSRSTFFSIPSPSQVFAFYPLQRLFRRLQRSL